MVKFLKGRLQERSTWVGFSMIAAAFGYPIDPALFEGLLFVLGIAHSVLPDKRTSKESPRKTKTRG